MTRKLLISAALVLLAFPVIAQASAVTPARPTADTATPLKIGGDVLPPMLISSVEPKYPHSVFHKPKPSKVIVGLVVSIDGTPTNMHIIKSGGDAFDKSALKAVSQYRFKPSTLNGKPVAVSIKLEVEFRVI